MSSLNPKPWILNDLLNLPYDWLIIAVKSLRIQDLGLSGLRQLSHAALFKSLLSVASMLQSEEEVANGKSEAVRDLADACKRENRVLRFQRVQNAK